MLTAEARHGGVLVSGDLRVWLLREEALRLMLDLGVSYQLAGDIADPGAVFLRTEVEKLVLDLLSKEHA